MSKYVLVVELSDAEVAGLDREIADNPVLARRSGIANKEADTCQALLVRAFVGRDKTDRSGLIPVITWVGRTELSEAAGANCATGLMANEFDDAWIAAFQSLSKTRPLIVGDCWRDIGNRRCKAEAVEGSRVLVSWRDPSLLYDSCNWNEVETIVGMKRSDGTIIGPPEWTSVDGEVKP